MAIATKQSEYKEVIQGYTLTLTPLEAEVLRALVGSVFGDEDTTYRDVTTSIWRALRDVGLDSHLSEFFTSNTYIEARPL